MLRYPPEWPSLVVLGNSRMRRRILNPGVALALLLVSAGARAQTQERPCVWTNVARIVAVGDVHGDYDQFVKALRLGGVVDADRERGFRVTSTGLTLVTPEMLGQHLHYTR